VSHAPSKIHPFSNFATPFEEPVAQNTSNSSAAASVGVIQDDTKSSILLIAALACTAVIVAGAILAISKRRRKAKAAKPRIQPAAIQKRKRLERRHSGASNTTETETVNADLEYARIVASRSRQLTYEDMYLNEDAMPRRPLDLSAIDIDGIISDLEEVCREKW
jgi:hypothetical protein